MPLHAVAAAPRRAFGLAPTHRSVKGWNVRAKP